MQIAQEKKIRDGKIEFDAGPRDPKSFEISMNISSFDSLRGSSI